ncbi:MAG: hypothetical protein NUV78_01485 [Candidatus Zambryskibacteria bacterium]|nr:hypothetical protein [Candidatus Zambryskibacteria bacterium]
MSNITQKPEKIASALYLLTSFFTDPEPIKWKLRALAGDLISVGLSLSSNMFKEREAARLEIRIIVLEVGSLISVAKNAGLISEPNYTLLHGELLKYLELLGFPAGLREENGLAVLSQNFFATEENRLSAPAQSEEIREKDKTQEGKKSYLQSFDNRANDAQSQGQKQRENKDKDLKEYGAVSVKKNSRQSVIIGLLKRKKEIMIKDVSPLISGCSEKTIQRELSAMVQAGILRKTGEKRWSRYSLA